MRIKGHSKPAVVGKGLRGVSALVLFEMSESGVWSMHERKLRKLSCVMGESVVKDCTTAAVVVTGERASNRGIKNR